MIKSIIKITPLNLFKLITYMHCAQLQDWNLPSKYVFLCVRVHYTHAQNTFLRTHKHTYSYRYTRVTLSVSIHMISTRMTVGGLELSWLPIRTSACCKEKTLRSNSNHEIERERVRVRETVLERER